jgi:hypothetical protein
MLIKKLGGRAFKFKAVSKKSLGGLLFLKKHSNIFLVLSNYKKKHIITLTAGNCKLGKNKKKKISPFNVLSLVLELKAHMFKHNMKFLNFYFKQRFSRYFFNLRKVLKLNEIKINKYIFLVYKSHGLIRKRKIRRI